MKKDSPSKQPHTLPSGLYDELLTHGLDRALDDPKLLIERSPISPDICAEALALHIQRLIRAALSSLSGNDQEKVTKQVDLANHLLDWLSSHDTSSTFTDDDYILPERLLSILRQDEVRLGTPERVRPSIPLRHSDLIVNGPQDLRIGREIKRELASADRVDVLVSFVKWSGFIELREAFRALNDRFHGKPPLRILTTTYMGATDPEALDALSNLGAEVRVSYDTRRTRLHAKAWLFHRDSGFSTGLIGSSNLSHAALRDGCEWNVRLSRVDNAAILRKFEATFAQYWDEGAFEPYNRDRFTTAMTTRNNPELNALAAAIRLHPYPHQAAVLESLAAERAAGHTKNLVIAATGTGKTVIAALDYKALCAQLGGRPSLLFVAHRHEILEKSRATYRSALGEAFGELLTGRDKPVVGRHVFASIQSLHEKRLETLAPDAYDIVVVDEFHHAEANSYTALLEHLQPKVLLGLTATPERTDGRSILHWFDGRIAAESRLWDALDQELLVPFQYFGVHDGTDLSHIDFRAGRYDVPSLEKLYTADDLRAKQVLRALHERVRDPRAMRALGFCVSIAHATYMAAFFCAHNLPAQAITGTTPMAEREAAVRALTTGELCALFTVDVFNEGVDIPLVDTVLFLRPTESATLFLQQLGRGLRLHESKSCLTVLDFIGRANRRFRFDQRFKAMLGGGTRAEVSHAIQDDFPRLPSGCSIELEEEAQHIVLHHIKSALPSWGALASELEEDWSLATFLERADIDLQELYANRKSFALLRQKRGYLQDVPTDAIMRALPRILHIDDEERLTRWRAWLAKNKPPVADPTDPYQLMFFATLGQSTRPIKELDDFFAELWSNQIAREELSSLLAVLDDRRRKSTYKLENLPFQVHATYSRDEVSAGLLETRKGKLLRTQGGVYQCKEHRCDILFVTLEKDEQDFTPTTLYNDYALSRQRFHWESQASTRFESPTGKRYLHPPEGWRILLFVRQAKKDTRGLTMPYLFLGPVQCDSASGERPIQIIWELEHKMPAAWFNHIKIAAA